MSDARKKVSYLPVLAESRGDTCQQRIFAIILCIKNSVFVMISYSMFDFIAKSV